MLPAHRLMWVCVSPMRPGYSEDSCRSHDFWSNKVLPEAPGCSSTSILIGTGRHFFITLGPSHNARHPTEKGGPYIYLRSLARVRLELATSCFGGLLCGLSNQNIGHVPVTTIQRTIESQTR